MTNLAGVGQLLAGEKCVVNGKRDKLEMNAKVKEKRGNKTDVPNNSSRYGSKVISTIKAHLKGLEGQSLIEGRNV